LWTAIDSGLEARWRDAPQKVIAIWRNHLDARSSEAHAGCIQRNQVGGATVLPINYRNGCDVLDVRNYSWYDAGVSAAVGAIAPGWLGVGKTTANSGRAVANLFEQLSRAQTLNRVAKIESRIASHATSIADVVDSQEAFHGVKAIGKQVTGASGTNDCTCRK
jgi:hypothetical protein